MDRLARAAALLALAVVVATALPTGASLAAAPALFGTAEFRAESHAALPQWGHELLGIAAEAAAVEVCARDAGACPSRGTAAWAALLRGVAGEPRLRQVREINRFISAWEYRTDADNYGRSDYWATPFEFFRRSGDCEDYAIAKYRSLRLLGLPADQLLMVVVQDVVRDLPHAVLAVYLEDNVYILDNLTDAVLPQARVGHYVPYYSVNEVTRWAHT
ncbi:MAG TPA: transglutaminase-like cysteine peptidase, partial [Geminicoccaceae bacterium]|nr:transglutaminase-like cysteine peptidase [Geminicoccaceae bacterium]